MEIRIQSLKFDADQKLLEFIEKKVAKLERFVKDAEAEVTLSLIKDPQNKNVKLQIFVPREETLIIERNSSTFETAIDEVVDVMKEKIIRSKERKQE